MAGQFAGVTRAGAASGAPTAEKFKELREGLKAFPYNY
jgi:hypothetical protein